MNADRLLALYHRIAEAPDAVERLRRFVLDLAVRGKLVPQDASDGNTADLHALIKNAWKHRLASGEVKRPFQSSALIEVPFGVPTTWTLLPVGQVLQLINGRAFKPTEWSKRGLRIVRIQNLNNPSAPFNRFNGPIQDKFRIDTGDFLISWSGTPGTSFGAHIWDRGPAVLNQHIYKSVLIGDVFDKRFLKIAINARLLELIEQAHGGVGLQHITKPKLEAVPITLPPLAEQHRIVAKVDELMALCNELEQAQAVRQERRDRLTHASLARLTEPGNDPTTFRVHARFAIRGLSVLTARPDQVKRLRETILNLAVRGKLVAQDPADEPASELLRRISEAKTQLVKSGKLKPRKLRFRPRQSPLRFDIPEGWELTDLDSVVFKITDGAHKTPTYVNQGVPFVSVKDFSSGRLDLSNTRFITPSEHEVLYRRCDPRRGDILLGRIGTLGKAVLVDTDTEFSLFVSVGLIRIDHVNIEPRFFRLLLNSPFVYSEFERIKIGGGTHTNKLNLGDLHTVALPLPPLAEQQRIVAKVDELTTVCDELEAGLGHAEEVSGRFLESVLHDAVA